MTQIGAFTVWTDFKKTYHRQIEQIGALEPEEVVSLASELSTSINWAIGIGVEGAFAHSTSKDKLIHLNELLSGRGNKVIFMRHGEQSPPEWIFSISHPALRKIRMMQNPFNKEDLLTNKGLIDVFATAFDLFYMQEVTGKRTHILTSDNGRAKEVGLIISKVVPNSSLSVSEGLSGITYKDESDEPPVTLEQILENIPSGMIPWEPKLVDKLCKRSKNGLPPSELIIKTIYDLVRQKREKDSNCIQIALTHTQQLAEALRVSGKLKDPAIRFSELTMLVSGNSLEVLPGGVLTERTRSA